MSKLFNCVMGEPTCSPFAPRSKMIAPVVAGAAIAGGASLLGNAIGALSNKGANQTNLEIARMNNEQQYKIFREQNAFNLDMWNKNNEYNLPENQVARLRAAGINPAAVFGNGSTTPASQIQSATAPQLHTPQVRPFSPDFSGVGESVNAFFDNQIKNKTAQGIGLDNQAKQVNIQFQAMEHLSNLLEKKANINKILSETKKNSAEYDNLFKMNTKLDLDIKRYQDTYDELVRREKLQNDVYENQATNLLADSTLKRAQASYQNLLIQWYPEMTQAQLNVLQGQYADLLQSAALKAKDGELRSAQAVSQYLANGIQAMDYERAGLKHKIKHGSGKIPQTFWYSLDMVGDAIFGNLRLFGK